MKKQVTSILLIIALSAPVMADSGHGHNGNMPGGMKGKGMGNSHMQRSMMMGMMSHDQMQKMQNHMQEMQKEKDPEKLAKLMEGHMEMMQGSMHMMMGGSKGMGKTDAASINMDERMDMMGNRMNMMQMMDHMSMVNKQGHMSENELNQ